MDDRRDTWLKGVTRASSSGALTLPVQLQGRVSAVSGLVVEAVGIRLPVGAPCEIERSGGERIEAEVVGFREERLFLMPQSSIDGVIQGGLVRAIPFAGKNFADASSASKLLPVGRELLGRVVDAAGRPIDERGPLHAGHHAPLHRRPANPLSRAPVTMPLDVGVRAINSLLTVGRGQRMGLFAGSGVGKSVLLAMMARYTEATVIVVGLIGERGREVKEFIEQILGTEGLRRSVVVAAPADAPALMRLQGAAYATSIAEHFRDEGEDVLLIMDSLTRYAMAQREIALAVGEPPATKGYPPSVFAKLPTLVERAGNGCDGGGSITAFYTVLTEGDDQQDPIADAARAILDGHIVLSRTLAESGHYPAIDVEQSISRVMHNIVSADDQARARQLKQMMSKLTKNRDLINVGAYAAGRDQLLDFALARQERIMEFLRQDISEKCDATTSNSRLKLLLSD